MSFQVLFAALCAVIAVNILVVVVAIRNAYREERRIRHSQRVRASFAQGWLAK
jgi:hypothetical protein